MRTGGRYRGGADLAAPRRNADVRASCFTRPGPTSTSVPADGPVHDEALARTGVVAVTGRS